MYLQEIAHLCCQHQHLASTSGVTSVQFLGQFVPVLVQEYAQINSTLGLRVTRTVDNATEKPLGPAKF